MIKRWIIAILAFILGVGTAGCGERETSGEKVYRIATDVTFPPFEFQGPEKEYVGIDIDLVDAIAKDQGFQYELQFLGFSAAVTALESNQADAVIAGMSITTDREKKYDFSKPYYDAGVVLATKAGNTEIQSYSDLKGKRVAVKTGTEGAAFAESIKGKYGFEVAYFKDSPMMYEEVKTGGSAACFEDYPVMGYGIANGNGLEMVTEMEKGASYGFAVIKGRNSELLEMFNRGLENIKKDGTYEQIIQRYIAVQ